MAADAGNGEARRRSPNVHPATHPGSCDQSLPDRGFTISALSITCFDRSNHLFHQLTVAIIRDHVHTLSQRPAETAAGDGSGGPLPHPLTRTQVPPVMVGWRRCVGARGWIRSRPGRRRLSPGADPRTRISEPAQRHDRLHERVATHSHGRVSSVSRYTLSRRVGPDQEPVATFPQATAAQSTMSGGKPR